MSDYVDSLLADPAVATIGLAVAIAGLALWLAAAWWAYGDATRRTERGVAGYLAAAWILLSTPILLPLALAVYACARPGVTAPEQRSTALVMELLTATAAGPACRGCRAWVDSSWLRCPTCATWLAAPCAACGEWAPEGLEICPFCAGDAWAAPSAIAPLPAPLGLGRARRPRRVGRSVRPRVARTPVAGHGTAAASALPAAAGATRIQRDRFISSTRPRSYAASRESLSAPS